MRQNILATLEHLNLRDETLDGKMYLVAPVVLLVEGVHTGTGGALYYSPEEIAAHAETWNGVPVPVFHPVDIQGEPASANTPEVIEQQSVGTLFDVHFESDGSKLKGEVWINIEKAEKVSPGLVASIRTGTELDVSTGMYMEHDMTPGDWNGEAYVGIAKDFRPDHLALLPGGQDGACSWDDGCGIRANKAKEDRLILFDNDVAGSEMPMNKSLIRRALDWLSANIKLTPNEASHEDIRQKLREALVEAEPDGYGVWVREVYDNRVIYEITEYTDGMPSGPEKLYERAYTSDSEGNITLASDKQEVKEETKYVPVIQSAGIKKTEDTTVKEDNVKKKEEMVTALISCERTKFTDEDKEWLTELSECQLEKLEVAEVKAPEKKPDEEPPKPVDNAPPEPNSNPADPTDGGKPVTLEEYVAKAPPEMQEVLNRSIARDAAVKNTLVKALLANDRNKFAEDKLRSMTIEDLEGMTELGNVEVDYAGQAPGVQTHEDDNEIPAAPLVWDNLSGSPVEGKETKTA